MVDGFVGLRVGRSFGMLVASLWIRWLLVLVRRSVSHLDDRSIRELGGCGCELDCLVGWIVGG